MLAIPALAVLLASQQQPGPQTLMAVALIAVLGVPHGALDGELARAVLRPRFGRAWFAVFSLPYLASAAGVLLAWRAAPELTLAGFLAASVWHFGAEDAGSGPRRVPSSPAPLEILARGGMPVAIPVLLHPAATAAFLATISLAPMPHLPTWLPAASWLWCALAALWTARALQAQTWPALADAVLVAALFTALPPLPAFAVYFVCLHAPRHMRAFVAERRAPRVGCLRAAIRRALPLTGFTFLIAAALWPCFPGVAPDRALALTLQMLAALTLPHMLLPPALRLLRPSQTGA